MCCWSLGAGLVLPAVVDRRNTCHRAALMGIVVLLALRYVWWRATETLAPAGPTIDCLASWSLFALECSPSSASLSAVRPSCRASGCAAQRRRA